MQGNRDQHRRGALERISAGVLRSAGSRNAPTFNVISGSDHAAEKVGQAGQVTAVCNVCMTDLNGSRRMILP